MSGVGPLDKENHATRSDRVNVSQSILLMQAKTYASRACRAS